MSTSIPPQFLSHAPATALATHHPGPRHAHRAHDGRPTPGPRPRPVAHLPGPAIAALNTPRALANADLITLNGAQAGADEFFPVLVYVVLQANPPNLLSTVQYIKYFYEPRANGEDSYWWNQFVIAVQFIKTLNPAALKSSS